MLLTTRSRYAVISIIELAYESGDKPLSLDIISKRQNVSLSYLEQIFSYLKKADLVKSVKGPGGGYLLKKSVSEITVANIVDAVGESIKITRCKNSEIGCVKKNTKCTTHHLWQGLEMQIYQYLSSISVEKILKNEVFIHD